jgi:hypothetical protein
MITTEIGGGLPDSGRRIPFVMITFSSNHGLNDRSIVTHRITQTFCLGVLIRGTVGPGQPDSRLCGCLARAADLHDAPSTAPNQCRTRDGSHPVGRMGDHALNRTRPRRSCGTIPIRRAVDAAVSRGAGDGSGAPSPAYRRACGPRPSAGRGHPSTCPMCARPRPRASTPALGAAIATVVTRPGCGCRSRTVPAPTQQNARGHK